ncbi:vWA domain-containing protein [Bremerella cremea]|uniref:vWA domain-containing protein n=1 Tax=Bremerella cremea TaxID=1031537 RepID=UPI0031EEE39B
MSSHAYSSSSSFHRESTSRCRHDPHPEHDDAPVQNRWWFKAAIWSMPAWLISVIVHCLGLTTLLLATLSPPPLPQALNLVATDQPESEELEQMVLEIEPQIEEEVELAMAAPQLMSESIELLTAAPDPVMMSEAISVEELMPTQTIDFAGMNPDGLLSEIDGLGDDVGKMTKFFGTGAKGRKILFLVDNSISMGGGRMETALIELRKTIEGLTPNQEFYIIFYSDTAYPLFYPSVEKQMVHANDKNKKKVTQWLDTVQMCLLTDGRDAITLALQLEPDLIYILGDGAFTDNADVELANTKLEGITIHTLGMQVLPKDRGRFSAIATAHGGTYKDVGITEEGRKRLQSNGPIPSNRRRNGVWGVKLPGG